MTPVDTRNDSTACVEHDPILAATQGLRGDLTSELHLLEAKVDRLESKVDHNQTPKLPPLEKAAVVLWEEKARMQAVC